jgi:hypothetical protein
MLLWRGAGAQEEYSVKHLAKLRANLPHSHTPLNTTSTDHLSLDMYDVLFGHGPAESTAAPSASCANTNNTKTKRAHSRSQLDRDERAHLNPQELVIVWERICIGRRSHLHIAIVPFAGSSELWIIDDDGIGGFENPLPFLAVPDLARSLLFDGLRLIVGTPDYCTA